MNKLTEIKGRITKNPKYLIPAISLAVIWLVTNILNVCHINPTIIKILRAVTFADAGVSSNPVKFIGGVIGKGMYASALYAVINFFKNKGKTAKQPFFESLKQSFSFKPAGAFIYLLGVGIAPFIMLFMAGRLSIMSVGGGVAATIIAAKNAVSGGIISKFVNLCVSKCKKLAPEFITKNFMSGMTAGMALFTLLGIKLSDKVVMIIAASICFAAIVLIILSAFGVIKLTKKKEVQS